MRRLSIGETSYFDGTFAFLEIAFNGFKVKRSGGLEMRHEADAVHGVERTRSGWGTGGSRSGSGSSWVGIRGVGECLNISR